VGEKSNNVEKRLGYLSYNGDLVVMTTLLLIAGAILSGITIGLFSLIGFNIERFYFDNVIKFALPAAPILGTYLTQANPQLVGKVSPVIAKIFSPLVLLMLSIYLIAIVYSGKDPYNDREFLMIFNALLIGVMAIIFFSVAESSKTGGKKMETWILFLLSCLTIIVNVIAVSAILFRISEWGLSPNRAAVLGGNVLILINLLMVTVQLFRAATRKTTIDAVGKVISIYLPIYCAWTCIVTFLFPFLFGFK
jgi:fumarate reductase subunit C